MRITQSAFELALKLAYRMQQRQIEIMKTYLKFNKCIQQRWIAECKMMDIWPDCRDHSQRLDIYG